MTGLPRLGLWLCVALLASGCAAPSHLPPAIFPDLHTRLDALLPTDALLLGEQHDAPQHQRIHHDVIEALAQRRVLAAVVLEMAEQGQSTRDLPFFAPEFLVRHTLQWNDRQWPWAQYGPPIMAAVRHGVPVVGANLPRAQMRSAMEVQDTDHVLDATAWRTQQEQIRSGHCGMLPESQITPMARVQIARDRSMAHAITTALQPGQTVVLLAGAGHADRQLGVPRHLPAGLTVKSLQLRAQAQATEAATDSGQAAPFDQIWPTAPLDAKDYCATFQPQNPRPQATP